jgi:hypothetical protein
VASASSRTVLAAVVAEVVEGHARPVPRELQRDRPADPRRPAGDDGDAPAQAGAIAQRLALRLLAHLHQELLHLVLHLDHLGSRRGVMGRGVRGVAVGLGKSLAGVRRHQATQGWEVQSCRARESYGRGRVGCKLPRRAGHRTGHVTQSKLRAGPLGAGPEGPPPFVILREPRHGPPWNAELLRRPKDLAGEARGRRERRSSRHAQ